MEKKVAFMEAFFGEVSTGIVHGKLNLQMDISDSCNHSQWPLVLVP